VKRCKICRTPFAPMNSMSIACSVPCAIAWAGKLAEKKARQEARESRRTAREARESIKTRGDHLREAQAAFNAFIRLRDWNLPCISCMRPPGWAGQWDAGHYRSRGSTPALRFDPLNVHKQCLPCNRHLSGNLIPFRFNLIEKIGLDKVKWLEGPHAPKKYSIAEIKEIKAHYRAEVRRLKAESAQ
jgi:hypothetical protein